MFLKLKLLFLWVDFKKKMHHNISMSWCIYLPCGDAGTRTLVQTKQLNAFYMFIFCSDFRSRAGTEANGAFILSSVYSDCDRSISLT